MTKIRIKEGFQNDWITRVAGERLRQMILEATEKGEKVEIDFSGVAIASTSFFDEGFAKLADCGWTMDKLNSQILFTNINKKDMYVLKEMCKNRGMK